MTKSRAASLENTWRVPPGGEIMTSEKRVELWIDFQTNFFLSRLYSSVNLESRFL